MRERIEDVRARLGFWFGPDAAQWVITQLIAAGGVYDGPAALDSSGKVTIDVRTSTEIYLTWEGREGHESGNIHILSQFTG